MAVASIFLNVLPEGVEGRTAETFAGTWTPVMPNPPVGFVAMPNIVGVMMPWRLQMVQMTWRVHDRC